MIYCRLLALHIQISTEAQFPLLLMKPAKNESDPKIWTRYRDIVETADGRHYQWAKLNRAKFYEESKRVILESADGVFRR